MLLPVFMLAASAACAAPEAADRLQEWSVVAEPQLAIGDREERDSMVLARVTDARLLRSGLLAVADAGAFQVLVFDAAGRRLLAAGRRGRGPGEFTGGLSLVERAGDSVVVWDAAQYRWTGVDVRGGGTRAIAEAIAAPTLLHAGLFVQSDLPDPPAWVPRLLSGLSAASAEVRVAHLDASGLLWVSQDAAMREWRVYVDSGAPVARLLLPAGLSVLHFMGDALVGIASDSSGLEQVVVHPIRRTATPAPDRTPAMPPAVDADARNALQSSLRNAVVAQEVHFMTHSAYTAHADSLEFPLPPEARFKVVTATGRGWRGVAWYPATGYTCAMIVGLPVPAGWGEGEARCGW